MDLTPRGDIIVAVQDMEVATAIMEAGQVKIVALKGAIIAPTGPVVEEGEVNYRRYSLRANPSLDMSIEEIAQYLEGLRIKVREIILETKGNTNIPCGGIQIYAQFPSVDAAHNFSRKHTINGKRVFFRHPGLLICNK